jgi:uncharacterized protein YsxB (DUF464 family)
MTTIKIDKFDNRVLVEITGHAGYRPGNDIVCAAVSMLTSTLAQCVMDEEMQGNITIDYMELQDGNVNMDFNYIDSAAQKIETVIETVYTGFELLAEKYPDYISLE